MSWAFHYLSGLCIRLVADMNATRMHNKLYIPKCPPKDTGLFLPWPAPAQCIWEKSWVVVQAAHQHLQSACAAAGSAITLRNKTSVCFLTLYYEFSMIREGGRGRHQQLIGFLSFCWRWFVLSPPVYLLSSERHYFFMIDDSSRSMLWKITRERKHEAELASRGERNVIIAINPDSTTCTAAKVGSWQHTYLAFVQC